jgi:hypothetical protein
MNQPSPWADLVRSALTVSLSGGLSMSLFIPSAPAQMVPSAAAFSFAIAQGTESTSPQAEDEAGAEPDRMDDDTVDTTGDGTTATLDSYTYADLFAIGLPSGWQATEQANAPQVILTHSGDGIPQADNARTEITWHEQPPEVVVAQLLNDLKEQGYRVSRYEPEGIDGTTALNIWLTDLPDDLPNAFMSYIGYTDTTAAVVSYYTAPNSSIESLLVEIHESFERLN